MLQRVLEPEVMDSAQEAAIYDAMDHYAVNAQFVQDLLSHNAVVGEVLDLGTGTARIPLLLCDASEDVRIVAADLATEMLDVARINLELSPHLERVLLAHCDAKLLEFEDGRFDVVISNSIIHHIPDPASVFAESVRVCRPNGILFFRDLIRPSSETELSQLVETYVGDEEEGARKMFADSLRAAFTIDEIGDYVGQLGFPEDSVSASSDRHWTWKAVKPGPQS